MNEKILCTLGAILMTAGIAYSDAALIVTGVSLLAVGLL